MDRTAASFDFPSLAGDGTEYVERPANRPCNRRRMLLKEATASLHGDLDRHVSQSGYFRCQTGFSRYIAGMYAFHRALEVTVRDVDQALLHAWDIDRHAHWILADLDSAAMPGDAGSNTVHQTKIPHLTDRSSLIGALYVVEGSSLGAAVLHRITVERALPREGGSAYLARLATGRRWARFIEFLETADIDDENSMLRGARSTFASVSTHLGAAVRP